MCCYKGSPVATNDRAFFMPVIDKQNQRKVCDEIFNSCTGYQDIDNSNTEQGENK
jgi:hypothetical protein